MLIGDIVGDIAREQPALTAATLGTASVSFGELDAAANRLAHVLAGLGVDHGTRVAWWSGPALHNLDGMLACARLGAVFTPLPPELGEAEAGALLDYLAAGLVVCDGAAVAAGASRGAVAFGDLSIAAAAAPSEPVGAPAVHETDPHIIYLTSGSTGRPKGVLVSHRASWLRSRRGGGSYGDDLDGVLCSFPLHHYGGWHYVLEAWLNRVPVHLVRRADGSQLMHALLRHRPNAVYCIPAVWERLLDEPGELDFVRYADTGTSAVAGGLLARIAARMPGARTTILYGATEAGRMTALPAGRLREHPGSVGTAVDPGRVRITADGEILYSGPALMDGYLGLPEETAAVIEDGWYHTGDVGEIDADGYLAITGRKREVIRSGGESVSPSEVETALGRPPGVDDLAVVGIPDPRWGEIVCAAVVVGDGSSAPTVDQLRARLTDLSGHKHPRLVAAVGEIPRTSATGQVMRGPLREVVLATLAQAGS